MSDEFYNRYLIKHNLLDLIVRIFLETEDRNNLINSACLELFDYIRLANQKTLLAHLVTQFDEQFKNVDYVKTFKLLVRRYEQNMDTSGALSSDETVQPFSVTVKQGGGSDWSSSTIDETEEAYFNNSDDDDEELGTSLVSELATSPQPPLSPSYSPMPSSVTGRSFVDSPRPPARRPALTTNLLVDYDDDDESAAKASSPGSPLSPGQSIVTPSELPTSSKRTREEDGENGEDESLVKGRVVPGGIKLVVKGTKNMKIGPQVKKRKSTERVE